MGVGGRGTQSSAEPEDNRPAVGRVRRRAPAGSARVWEAGMSAATQGRLAGKTIVVTGAAHGIGKAYARRLVDEGARVVVAARQ